MARSRADEILEGWKMVAHSAARPEYAPAPGRTHSLPLGMLVGLAGVILVVAVAARMQQSPGVGSSMPSASPTASPSPTESARPTASPSPMVSALPTTMVPTPESTAVLPTAGPTASVGAGVTAAPVTARPSTPAAGQTPSAQDAEDAKVMLDRYLSSLVAGDYQGAYSMLSPVDRAVVSLADFQYERAAYFKSVKGKYTITAWPKDVGPIANWIDNAIRPSIDLRRAVLVEVDYPALATNNAGWELYIVSPDSSDRLWIFPVR